MSNIPKISIVVPVYNVESYLKRCLDSIQNQTFQAWECILIDDGSKDNSGKICDDYSIRDKRFRVIHQNNKGVSSARNAGLENAKGKYIGFVDSDDWIEPNMYEYLYNDAIETQADVCICGFIGQNYKRVKKMYRTKKALILLFTPNRIGGFSFLRLIAAEKIKQVRFDENVPYMEDKKFFYDVFKLCSTVYWDNEPLYHYEKREDSVTGKKGLTNAARIGIGILEDIKNNENNKCIKNEIKTSLDSFLIDLMASCVCLYNADNKNILYLQAKIKKDFWHILFARHLRFKQKILALILINENFLKHYKILKTKK